MTSHRNGRQTPQGMMALLSAIFPAPAPIPVRSRKSAAVRVRSVARPSTVTLPGSGLKGAILQGLVSVSLACVMGGLLVAYNLRDTIAAQAARWVMSVMG